jgi:iron-chelate-transporting ATPase
VLKTNEVSLSIDQKTIVHPVNAQFDLGKIYGIVGHNGSGKSTYIKLLAKQLSPSSGEILLDDTAIDTLSQRRLSQQIAYLPQYLPSLPNVKVYDLVKMGRYPWKGIVGRYTDQDEAIIQNALAQANVAALQNDYVDILSGGERQRAWLAMCLAQQSPYLLLDEPLSALDLHYQLEIMQLLQQLSSTTNMCIIIILHDINLVAQYCDAVLAFKQGRLILNTPADQVIQPDILHDIYQLDFSILPHPKTGKLIALP